MLVLTRGKGESIVIGDAIEISVVEIRGDKVRLGISAPADVAVHRKEVWVAIRDANIAAADAHAVDLAAELLKKKLPPPGGGVPPPAAP